MRVFVIVLWLLVYAQAHDMTTGEWRSETKAFNAGTHVIEREILRIKPDHTFTDVIDVSLQKDDHFIKDLQIKAEGRWKRYITTLVFVVDRIDVPFAKEVSDSIDMRSLQALSAYYKRRFDEEPIRITTLIFLDEKTMKFRDEKGAIYGYTKASEILPKLITPPKPISVDEALKRQRRK